MQKSFEEKLRAYADVVVNIGVNVQPGQRVLIGPLSTSRRGAPLESAPLCRLLAESAYRAGAREVEVAWHDPLLDLVKYQHASEAAMGDVPMWRADLTRGFMERADAVISVYAPIPGLFDEVNPHYLEMTLRKQQEVASPLMNYITTNAVNWCVIAYPVKSWYDKILAEVPEAERENEIWNLIFDIVRVSHGDPVDNWADHVKALTARADYLNARQYDHFVYTGPGTDLVLGLPEGHRWQAAQSTAANGVTFTANIPTEEVFTLPHRERAEGVVTATKPLVHAENLMDEFVLTFENGRVVKATAKQGENYLNKLLDTDEGARRLGEVALVPHSSPISQSGRLFFNTLYDENASCHVALGRAYQFTLDGGLDMSNDEFVAAGGNDSKIHVDFMIGSGELDIEGVYADGRSEPVLRQGEYAFDV